MRDEVSANMEARKNQLQLKGFSLIELLIVIVVISVLAAIAIPMYSSYVLRAHRSDAISSLNLVAMNEEAFMLSAGSYATSLNQVWSGTTSTRGYYDLTLLGVSSSGYTVQAIPTGNQTADSGTCPDLTLVISDGSITKTPIVCWE